MRRSSAFLEDKLLSLLDLIIAAGFFTAGYIGYRSGAATKAFTLVSILFAVLVAARFMRSGASLLAPTGNVAGTGALVAAFLVIAAAILVVLFLILRRLATTKLFKGTGRVAGVLLGLVEGCLVMSIVFWGLRAFDEPGERLRTRSRLYAPVLGSVPACFEILKPYLPGAGEFRELVGLK